jgi:hypothetical protein
MHLAEEQEQLKQAMLPHQLLEKQSLSNNSSSKSRDQLQASKLAII